MSARARKPVARTKEQTIQLNRWGREWLMAFAAILRTSQFHDPKNQIFDEPIRTILRTTEETLRAEGRTEFRVLEDQFFLNGLWIKPTLTEKDNLFSLADEFRNMGLGGITVRVGATDAHWRLMVGIFHSAKGEVRTRASEINAALAAGGVEEIEVQRLLSIQDASTYDKPLPPASYVAVTSYAKALTALIEFSRAGPGEEQVTALRKAQRIVCDMIDICDKNPALFCALSLFRNFESYLFHHGVNVMILSLLIGREIGVGRKEAADLGMAALLHDVGRLMVPEEILSKTTDLTEEERERIARHPVESAKLFLSLGYMNESVAERVLVAYEHHWASRRPDAFPRPRRALDPSLMSQIVAVAVAYEALTSDKEYRAAFTPWEAIRILSAQNEAGFYRKEIVNALLRVLGPIPVGNWVDLGNGLGGLVVASGLYAPTPFFPLVLVLSPEGTPEWVDAARLGGQPGAPTKIVGTRTTYEAYRQSLRALFQSVNQKGNFGPEPVSHDVPRPA